MKIPPEKQLYCCVFTEDTLEDGRKCLFYQKIILDKDGSKINKEFKDKMNQKIIFLIKFLLKED